MVNLGPTASEDIGRGIDRGRCFIEYMAVMKCVGSRDNVIAQACAPEKTDFYQCKKDYLARDRQARYLYELARRKNEGQYVFSLVKDIPSLGLLDPPKDSKP